MKIKRTWYSAERETSVLLDGSCWISGDCEDSSPNEEGTFCFDEGFCMLWWWFDDISNTSSTLQSCWAAGLKWENFNRSEALPFLLWDDFGAQFSLSSISLYATEIAGLLGRALCPFHVCEKKRTMQTTSVYQVSYFFWWKWTTELTDGLQMSFTFLYQLEKKRNRSKTFYLYICVFQEKFLIPA